MHRLGFEQFRLERAGGQAGGFFGRLDGLNGTGEEFPNLAGGRIEQPALASFPQFHVVLAQQAHLLDEFISVLGAPAALLFHHDPGQFSGPDSVEEAVEVGADGGLVPFPTGIEVPIGWSQDSRGVP